MSKILSKCPASVTSTSHDSWAAQTSTTVHPPVPNTGDAAKRKYPHQIHC